MMNAINPDPLDPLLVFASLVTAVLCGMLGLL
jgi:hypothetical protein